MTKKDINNIVKKSSSYQNVQDASEEELENERKKLGKLGQKVRVSKAAPKISFVNAKDSPKKPDDKPTPAKRDPYVYSIPLLY